MNASASTSTGMAEMECFIGHHRSEKTRVTAEVRLLNERRDQGNQTRGEPSERVTWDSRRGSSEVSYYLGLIVAATVPHHQHSLSACF